MQKILLIALVVCCAISSRKVKASSNGQLVSSADQFPYQATFANTDGSSYEPFCGGTVLSSRFILTAGRCFKDRANNGLRAIVGVTNLNDVKERNLGYIDQIYIHPQFERKADGEGGSVFLNDIAVIKLSNDLSGVTPIALPTDNDPQEGVEYQIAGFGGSTPNSAFQSVLKSIKMQASLQNPCNPEMVASIQFCASGKESGKNSTPCQTDNGSGLAKSDKSVVDGIFSSMIDDCGKTNTALFTKVRPFVSWIQSKMQ